MHSWIKWNPVITGQFLLHQRRPVSTGFTVLLSGCDGMRARARVCVCVCVCGRACACVRVIRRSIRILHLQLHGAAALTTSVCCSSCSTGALLQSCVANSYYQTLHREKGCFLGINLLGSMGRRQIAGLK